MVNRTLFVDNSIRNSDWTKANAFDFPSIKSLTDFEQQMNIPSEPNARQKKLASYADKMWLQNAPKDIHHAIVSASKKKSLADVIKASFGGNRSEAGRYAANVRWQGRGKVSDITKELKSYFGKDRSEYKNSEGFKEVERRASINEKASKDDEDYQLEIIAEKQGFTGKPRVVTAQEMDELEKQGWTIAYRGIGDGSAVDGTKLKSEDLAKEFIEGDYYAGFGVLGNGTYMTTKQEFAEGYARRSGSQGTLLRIAIPPDSLMLFREYESIINEIRGGERNTVKEIFYGSKDFGRLLCAKGARGLKLKESTYDKDTIVVYDRSMLVVQELDTQK